MWKKTSEHIPPTNIILDTKICDNYGERLEQKLIKKGNLWWVEDESMYIFYTLTHWKHTD